MIYNFASGTAEQKALWQEAVTHLLNFPADEIALTVNVDFAPVSEVVAKGHNDLAITTWTYDDPVSNTVVRGDAPGFGGQLPALEAEAAGFGLPYSPPRFLMETAAHELGHSFFAALSLSQRTAIAKLFGAQTDDIRELEPLDAEWKNRIIEGIAETFKEAFLPARYRVFPNRTNRRIPYSLFPKFRHIFRQGHSSGTGFSYIYGGPDFRVDLTKYGISLPTHESNRDNEAFVFYEEIRGFETCWGVDMAQFAESSHHPFSIRPAEGGVS